MSFVFIITLSLVCVILGTDLNTNYSQNVILSVGDSPYHVISDTIVAEDAIMIVENGVEIIFDGDFRIHVKGELNVGCVNTNTFNVHTRGLYNYTERIYIHSQNYDRSGGITFDPYTDSNGTFCNVLFEGLYAALRDGLSSKHNSLVFDNCEFTNMWAISEFTIDAHYKIFTDCYFHNMPSVFGSDYGVFINCLFENFEIGVVREDRSLKYLKIYDSDIVGPSTNYCLRFYYECILENSIIKNCENALKVSYSIVKYNTFENNGISIAAWTHATVQFNNFVDDITSIRMYSKNGCPSCNYNYFGISSSNQSVIGEKINDECSTSGTGSCSGLVTWYPWYLNKINFQNVSELPIEATITHPLHCIGFDYHPSIIGNRLHHIYMPNSINTLTVSGSPYYVKYNVIIRGDAVLNIPSGVEIVFAANYYIKLNENATLNVGCYDLNMSNSERVIIRGLDWTWRRGEIQLHGSTDTVKFCNVLFEQMDYVCSSDGRDVEFEHCEFSNVDTIFGGTIDSTFTFTDCHFHHYDAYSGAFTNSIAEHCLFDNFVYSAVGGVHGSHGTSASGNFFIYNSDIVGDGVSAMQQCIVSLVSSVLENSTVSNCSVAVLSKGKNIIKYNTFKNNNVTVDIFKNNYYDVYPDVIQYNNFVNNNINIRLFGDSDCNFCNFNYFGVVDESAIEKTIFDICDGYSESLVTWKPWYLTPINFDDLTTLPTETSSETIGCVGSDNYQSILGNKLDVVYLSNTTTTLNITDSPYYLKSDVLIQKGAIMNIPNGVELIFVDNFYIQVEGIINVGCFDINTSVSHSRGLYLPDNKVYIHSIFNKTGGFMFGDSNSIFCNVLFEGLDVALSYETSIATQLIFDNCEFSTINTIALAVDKLQRFEFNDCYFHHVQLVSDGGTTIFDNCLIQDFETAVSRTEIYNSHIIGDGTQTCIYSRTSGCSETTVIKHSTFTNCGTAVNTGYFQDIKYNTFSNNIVAIKIYFSTSSCNQNKYIQYNNFLSNNINIQLEGWMDCINCTYNYFSTSSTNQTAIASSINDVCNGYGTRLVIFWPWLINAFSTMNDTENIRTFDYTDCDSIHSAKSYDVTTTTAMPTTATPTTTYTPTTTVPTIGTPTTYTDTPTTNIPTTAKPTTTIPTTVQPTTVTPTTAKPTTSIPTTVKTTTSIPTTVQPTTVTPTTAQPTTVMPTTVIPTTVKPTTATPTTVNSTTATDSRITRSTNANDTVTSLKKPATSRLTTTHVISDSTTVTTTSEQTTVMKSISSTTVLNSNVIETSAGMELCLFGIFLNCKVLTLFLHFFLVWLFVNI